MMITHTATLTLLLLTFTRTLAQLEDVATWRLATFDPPPGFPGASTSGDPVYAPNALITGLRATKNKFFLAFPRFLPYQPITLGWVSRPPEGYYLELDTPINAFPDWDWHRAAAGGADSASTNCSALVSVLSMQLDRCGRLWVVDSGVSNVATTFTASCPPKLLAFDTTTGEVLHRYEFPAKVIEVGSEFTNFVLDNRSPLDSCCSDLGDLFVYVADSRAPGIVVYDVQNCASWRHNPNQAYPDPDWGVFTVAGESFQLMDGVLGLALSCSVDQRKYGSDSSSKDRFLYFQAFASDRIYSVPVSALRRQPVPNEQLPITLVGRKSSQSAFLVFDPKDCSLIFSPVHETSIASFLPADNSVTVKVYSPELLQGVTDIYTQPEQTYVVSSRIQKYLTGTASAEEVNLRILKMSNGSQNHYYPYCCQELN